MKNVKNDSFV